MIVYGLACPVGMQPWGAVANVGDTIQQLNLSNLTAGKYKCADSGDVSTVHVVYSRYRRYEVWLGCCDVHTYSIAWAPVLQSKLHGKKVSSVCLQHQHQHQHREPLKFATILSITGLERWKASWNISCQAAQPYLSSPAGRLMRELAVNNGTIRL